MSASLGFVIRTCTAVLTVALISFAWAQTSRSAVPIDASTEDTTQLQEITVTAEKRAQNLENTPAAITRVSGDELTVEGIDSMTEVGLLFPSARFEPFSSSTHLYVRGIGAEQDRITVDQLVNISMDGVLLPREMDSVAQFDVNDIELLPGPQGTLYGASSVGGVITIANNRPTGQTDNKLVLETGNYGEFHVEDAQNFVVNDALEVRGAVDYTRHSAYETSGAWTADALAARIGLMYKPSDQFSAYIWGLVVNDDSVPADIGVVATNGGFIPANNPWDIVNSCITKACNGYSNLIVTTPNSGKTHDYLVAGQFDWHFDGFTVTDIPSYLHSESEQDSNYFVFRLIDDVDNSQKTNELKITSDSVGPLQWLAGLYLFENDASQWFNASNYNVPQYTNDDVAPYGQVTYSITDRLRTTIGGRYSWTKKEATFLGPNVLPETSATWSSVDWKAGLEYDLLPTTLTYLTAQTGSSPGTLDGSDPVNGRPSITDLTRLYSLTGGWKSRLFDNRFQMNNELFYYDYKDFLIQTVVCAANPCDLEKNVFLNAPKLISWGDQLDLRWLVTAADQASLGAAYTSTKTGHWITDAGANLSDQTLFEAPEVTLTFGGQHAFAMPSGGSTIFRVESHYENGYWADFETQPGVPVHLPSQHQAAFTTSDASLTYHAPREKWTIGLWSRNLENKTQLGPAAAFNFGPVGGIGSLTTPPRTFGLRFTNNMQ
jgi:iron complex outermembrane recepter protein